MEATQVSVNNSSSLSSAFKHNSTKQSSIKKMEKSPPKNLGKLSEVLSQIATKFNIRIKLNSPWGFEKDHLNENELEWMREFQDRLDISYINPGEKDHVHMGKSNRKNVYEQKCYLLWKIRDLHKIANGGEITGDVHKKETFLTSFGCKLKFGLLYSFLKSQKQYIFNQNIPQWSCLCEICEYIWQA